MLFKQYKDAGIYATENLLNMLLLVMLHIVKVLSVFYRRTRCQTNSPESKYHNTLCLFLQTVASALFLFSLPWDLQWSQEKVEAILMQILEGQTKSITVFLILAN